MPHTDANADDTTHLLEAVRAGDSGAIDRLWSRYRADLRRFIALRLDGRLRPRVDPSDLVQETLAQAARRITAFLDHQAVPFHVWLCQLALGPLQAARRRHVEAQRRAVAREYPLPNHSSVHLADLLLARGPTASQQVARDEQCRLVRQAVGQLSDRDREILLMRTFDNLSYDHIAYILRIDAGLARVRHGRALMRLGRVLRETGLRDSQQ